jgi:phytoene dehydrogenase-like protein
MCRNTVIVGAGYTGLAAASILASKGLDVTIIEKNDSPGSRGRGMEKLAREFGVKFEYNTPVTRIVTKDGKAAGGAVTGDPIVDRFAELSTMSATALSTIVYVANR